MPTTDELRPKIIGARIKRVEDPRLLAGEGAFADDRLVSGALHVAFRRSDHAHARIVSIDTAQAQAMPGVLGVFTADDLEGLVKPLVATLAHEELSRDPDPSAGAPQGPPCGRGGGRGAGRRPLSRRGRCGEGGDRLRGPRRRGRPRRGAVCRRAAAARGRRHQCAGGARVLPRRGRRRHGGGGDTGRRALSLLAARRRWRSRTAPVWRNTTRADIF